MKKIIALNFLLLLFSCKSGQHIVPNSDAYNIINARFAKFTSKKNAVLFYRTMENQIIASHKISDYIDYNNLSFLCVGKQRRIEFDTIFSENELTFIRKGFINMKSVRLDKKILGDNIKLTKKQHDAETIKMSFPLILPDKKHAVFYEEDRWSGSLTFLEYKDKNWVILCTKMIWIE